MKTIGRITGIIFLVGVMTLTGCAEDVKTSKMRVRMMSQGGENEQFSTAEDLSMVTAIHLDIRECYLYYSHPVKMEGWFALPCQVGVYNVLDIPYETSVILVHDIMLPHGTVPQFKWILGADNTIEIGGTLYPLKVPSAEESGLNINVNGNIYHDHWIEVRLIFDAEHSVVEQQNDEYILTPVIEVEVITQD